QSTSVSSTYNTDISNYDFDDSSFNYCQADFPSNASYVPVANATLEFVQVVVRHGDRSPALVAPHQDVTWNCDKYSENVYLKSDTTSEVSSSALVNQKTEIPVWNGKYGYSNQLWKGSCNVGELTDIGKAQHESLGAKLRSIYVEKLNFLPYWLSNVNQVYVRTTHYHRTKTSAESLLGGIWPFRGISANMAIPMHTYPEEIETMEANSNACPAINKVWMDIIGSDSYQKFFKGQNALMTKLARILDASGPIWTMVWDGYFDTLFTR
ncbi:hypothetical protein LPJ75_006756, partial [Coemansia sp. RSA 2598]